MNMKAALNRFAPLRASGSPAARHEAGAPVGSRDEASAISRAVAAGHGAALKAAARAERRRCAAILGSEYAQGSIEMACELAFDEETTLSAKSAVRLLAAAAQPSRNAAYPSSTMIAEAGKSLVANAKARAARAKGVVVDEPPPAPARGQTPGESLVANAKARAVRANNKAKRA